ncbi:MAG: hypothetical protein WBW93_16445 [Steroidobacteraceae bacterium]
MPLTQKGKEIKRNLVGEYGEKRGTAILYAGKNSGRFTGIDALSKAIAAGEREAEAQKQAKALLGGKYISGRDRAKLRR